ncbi:NAD-dependent epimerase/dehydratase family protein [Streptomyces sp. NPDC048269]|uniref:NAD-dependent epimerase/dehydratase family protein n=1 Tax=Streptomyces sp. NPDC048269 TaxID=3155753 RepID=UPI00343E25FF
MTIERILVTGATGFVGSHVVKRLLASAPSPASLRLLTHRTVAPAEWAGAEVAAGTLTDPASLRGICDGVTTVMHLAARIGGTEEECREVNAEGTRALLAEARRAGVGRVVQLGTAAVYKDVAHRGEAEGVLTEAPTSPTSVTRLEGERLVLAAGGTVLRPHLIYGDGDTWMIPALVQLLEKLPYWLDGGRARISLVSVDALAGALVELVRLPAGPVGGQVLHASHPEPVSTRELVTTVTRELGLEAPRGDLTVTQALNLLGAADDPVTRRRISLLAVDHWYDSTRLWSLVRGGAGPVFADAFARHAPWYRALLSR